MDKDKKVKNLDAPSPATRKELSDPTLPETPPEDRPLGTIKEVEEAILADNNVPNITSEQRVAEYGFDGNAQTTKGQLGQAQAQGSERDKAPASEEPLTDKELGINPNPIDPGDEQPPVTPTDPSPQLEVLEAPVEIAPAPPSQTPEASETPDGQADHNGDGQADGPVSQADKDDPTVTEIAGVQRYISAHQLHGGPGTQIRVIDEPGWGGAHHEYEIWSTGDGENKLLGKISFQNGPVKEAGINGVTEAGLLAIVADRLAAFQNDPAAGRHTSTAFIKTQEALDALHARTRHRLEAEVEGTNRA